MFKPLLVLAALAVAAATIPATAEAQGYGYRYNDGPPPPPPRGYYDGVRPWPPIRMPLGPREIIRKLRWQGYSNIDILNRRRDVYIMRAENRRGWDVMLVVDAFSGDVLRQRPVDDGWRGPRGGWGGDWRRW